MLRIPRSPHSCKPPTCYKAPLKPLRPERFRQPAMLPTPSSCGFTSGYPESCTLDDTVHSSCAQGYFGLHPTMLGDWYPPVWDHEVSPCDWQRSRAIGTQEVCDGFQTPTSWHIEWISLSTVHFYPPFIRDDCHAATGTTYLCCGSTTADFLRGSWRSNPQRPQVRGRLPKTNPSTPEVDRHS